MRAPSCDIAPRGASQRHSSRRAVLGSVPYSSLQLSGQGPGVFIASHAGTYLEWWLAMQGHGRTAHHEGLRSVPQQQGCLIRDLFMIPIIMLDLTPWLRMQGHAGGAQTHHEGLRPVPQQRGCLA